MHVHNLKNLCVAALLCVLPAAAFANPLGVWAGSVAQGTETISVSATFTERSVDIHFAGAAACRVKATYQKADGRALLYGFEISTNGGPFCDNLWRNVLEVDYAEGDDTLKISFGSSGKWSGTLDKQG
ncbi:hypothetical protein [Luteibacter sp.]|jgi:hypothetical protein|uniref:hypothetical protein n=1 Tax=Luteibacter sp. TaxID=1886636 RepID=UPI002F40F8A2